MNMRFRKLKLLRLVVIWSSVVLFIYIYLLYGAPTTKPRRNFGQSHRMRLLDSALQSRNVSAILLEQQLPKSADKLISGAAALEKTNVVGVAEGAPLGDTLLKAQETVNVKLDPVPDKQPFVVHVSRPTKTDPQELITEIDVAGAENDDDGYGKNGDQDKNRDLKRFDIGSGNATSPFMTKLLAQLRTMSPGKRAPTYLRANNIDWTIYYEGQYDRRLYTSPSNEVPKQRFPKAIIIGVPQCGTRALIEFLRMHPYIVTPREDIQFFDTDQNFEKGLAWYLYQMPLSYSNQMTLENSPTYIWSKRALQEIYKLNKTMKLIVVVRDPVARLLAQFIRNNGSEFGSVFLERMDGVTRVRNTSKPVQWGHYSKHLHMWTQRFPMSQIYVLDSTDLVTNPAPEMRKLEKFLQIPHRVTERNFFYNTSTGVYCMRPFHHRDIVCLSRGRSISHPTLQPSVEKTLYEYYSTHNEDLFQLIGRRFIWNPKIKLSVLEKLK